MFSPGRRGACRDGKGRVEFRANMEKPMRATKSIIGILTITASLAMQVHAQSWLTNGLVAYYPFNGNANDESRNGNNGSVQNATPAVDRFGVTDACYQFQNSWIFVPYNPALFPVSHTFSIWFKNTGPYRDTCLMRFGNNFVKLCGYGIWTTDFNSKFGFLDYTTSSAVIGTHLKAAINQWPSNIWMQLVVSRNEHDAVMYLNGQVLASATNLQPYSPPQSCPLYIGSGEHLGKSGANTLPTDPPTVFWNGYIDDVRIYNRALSDVEVVALYEFESANIVSQPAVWEGADDFSGTLAKWDTTYVHVDQPADGFFVSGGHLQFIRRTTTADDGSGGALIWPKSLPFNKSWTVLVDAHLKPLSAKSTVPTDQDIRAALYVFESVSTVSAPASKRLDSVLENGATSDTIRAVGIPSTPVEGGGWDFTLGVSFDSATKTGTSFYYPSNKPSQLIVLKSLNMGSWTNMQILLYGLSEYWAVSDGESWMDNFRVFGAANTSPSTALVKAVRPSFTNLILGRSYQLQVSSDMSTWTNQGTPFTATNFNMVYPQYWDVDNWDRVCFRLQGTP